MKKIMLIGDSIRLGYQQEVVKQLGSKYLVYAPEDNARFAKYTLNELERWFEKCPDPDIIHWNNGLWDTAVVCREDGAFTPIDEYIRYMSIILRELRKKTEKIIFATTTPVKPGSANQDTNIIKEYNKCIALLMNSENIRINNLYDVVSNNVDMCICEDKIHLTDYGKTACARAVANEIQNI